MPLVAPHADSYSPPIASPARHLEPSMNTQTPRTLGLRPLAHRVTALALAAGITFSVLAGLGQEADRSHDEARYAQTTRGLLSCQAAMAETGSKPA
jgi:hypothetical protein